MCRRRSSGYDFGAVALSASVDIQIDNTGDATLLVGTLDATTPFSIDPNTCAASVAPAQSCVFRVLFAPSAPKRFVTTIAVRTNDPLRLTQTLLVGGGYPTDDIFADGFDPPNDPGT